MYKNFEGNYTVKGKEQQIDCKLLQLETLSFAKKK